jgi:quercetin dioxygenase-like cupin family protein
MNVHQVNWEAIDWTPVRKGIDRKAFTGEGCTLALHRLQPGHELLPHTHPNEQIVYILEGEVDFHIGEETVRLTGGGLALVPPGVLHYVEVVGDKPALNLDVFTPARPEYTT